MLGRPGRITVLAVALQVGLAAAASAQGSDAGGETGGGADDARRDKEARSLFEAGRLAVEDGRYDEALVHFRRSYELSGRSALLYNVGMVAERLGHHEEALEAYEQYLEEHPDAPNRASVEQSIEQLRERVAAEREREAARAAEDDPGLDPLAPGPDGPPRDDQPVWKKWWLWTAVGAVVAGGVIAAVVLSSGGGTQDPLPGRDGVVVYTLGSAP